MARILLVWELGANLGHVGPLSVLGRELKRRSHEPIFALRDLRGAEEFCGCHGMAYVQAPLLRSSIAPGAHPLSYADLLYCAGFLDPVALLATVKAWRSLISLVAPEVIVLDHAPVALLASIGLQIPRVLYGSGFCIPPRANPFPSIRPWQVVPEDYLRQADEKVLNAVNRVLRRLNEVPLEQLRDLLNVEEEFLCTFEELDHYPGREGVTYRGPACVPDHGGEPVWPGRGTRNRVFGYVHPDTPHLEDILSQLGQAGSDFLWVIPNAPAELKEKMASPRVRFASELCRMDRVVQQCDAAITNAGHGATASLLLGGTPLLMIPRHLEQYLVARNVVRTGSGVMLEGSHAAPDYARTFGRLMDNLSYAAAAEAFADRHSEFSPRKQLMGMGERIEDLL
jgi:UDP:flavonoid glycosyltransferase YjiC (YdhE family)